MNFRQQRAKEGEQHQRAVRAIKANYSPSSLEQHLALYDETERHRQALALIRQRERLAPALQIIRLRMLGLRADRIAAFVGRSRAYVVKVLDRWGYELAPAHDRYWLRRDSVRELEIAADELRCLDCEDHHYGWTSAPSTSV